MHTIIIAEPKGYSQKAIKTLKKLGEVYYWPEVSRAPKILSRADVLVVKLGMRVSREIMKRMPKLRIIATSTTGLNHIDVGEAEERGINVISLRGESGFLKGITPTAEETIGLMIALMRRLPWGFEAVKRGQWERERYYGKELNGRTLGIVGFGRLGGIVARYARCFGMKVIAYDPYVTKEAMQGARVSKVTMSAIFKKADVVSIHVLLTSDTEGLVKRRHFRMMKPTAYFINTARGELIDEKALLEALRKKWIAGAALDVLSREDPTGGHIKNNSLIRYATRHENLFITPHLGGASVDAMLRTEEFIAEKVLREIRRL